MLSISIYNIIIGYHGINVQKKMCTNSYVFFFSNIAMWLTRKREREREKERERERERYCSYISILTLFLNIWPAGFNRYNNDC